MPRTNQMDKKVIAIFKLMKYFLQGREINAYDPIILDEFNCSYKTLERYLKDIEINFKDIITIKKSNKNYYKLVKASDIIREFLQLEDSDISLVYDWLKDGEIYHELEEETKKALKKVSKSKKEIMLFKSYPFEDFKSKKYKDVFDELKIAVKSNEYRDIVFEYDEIKAYKDVKCLKLIFVDNNWYIAIENENSKLKFLRISFIQNIKKVRDYSYQKSTLEKYSIFFKTFQNSLSLYGVERKKAILQTTPKIAKYFKKGMKKFFSSQEFMKEFDDGSIRFSLLYTQPLEILPFIKRWLPDMSIIEPKELKEKYRKDIKKMEELLK